jgi:hypothetical protein
MNYNNILEYCWIITTCDFDTHSITIGENYKNFYGVTHRINTVTNDVASIDYNHGFVSNSVTEEVFLDLDLLRDQITHKINRRGPAQTCFFQTRGSHFCFAAEVRYTSR